MLGNELVWGCGFTMYTVIMGHLGADAVAANSIANIVKDLLVCLSLGLGNAGGILVGNLLGRGDFRQAKAMGDRMCVLVAVVGTATGLLIVAARPLALQWANLTPEATRYLSVMLFVCAYYAACGCMTNLTIAGIFPAGGDAKFGLMCDAIVMWLIVVPVGLLAAFVFKLPVLVAAQHRRMHQNGSRVVALPQVPLAAQCHPMTFCDSAADFMIGLCATSL